MAKANPLSPGPTPRPAATTGAPQIAPVRRRKGRGGRWLIRTFSFFAKEINEVRRQIRLILSLVLGPFLILLLFGIGYQGDQPQLKTALVIPDGGYSAEQQERLRQTVATNFPLVYVGPDESQAQALLESGAVDVVEVLPPHVEEQVRRGQQAEVEFRYNEINPLNEQWIRYLSYAQIIEINRSILLETTASGQSEVADMQDFLVQARGELEQLRQSLSAVQRSDSRARLQQLSTSAGAFAASPLIAAQAQTNPEIGRAREDLLQLRQDLDELQAALAEDRIDGQRQRLDSAIARVDSLEQQMGTLREIPPEVLVSPLRETHANQAGVTLNLMSFYAPGVMALILQHIGVTLGALSLVRERLQGTLELFRVAPVSAIQLLLGKYVGFTLFITFIAAMLGAAMYGLGVPLLGSPWLLALVLLLLTLASLGVGFVISALSTSDSQAVQLSMLVLLLTVFFSGFFLPLENFWTPVGYLGKIVPLTHGIVGLQDVMLRGVEPAAETLLWLGGIALVLFLVSGILVRRQFRYG